MKNANRFLALLKFAPPPHVILLLFFVNTLMAQSDQCPTAGNPPDIYYDLSNNLVAPPPVYVKVYFHVFQESDGSGGLSLAQIEQAKTLMNNAYNPHDIYFIYDCQVDFIKNSSLYFNGLAFVPIGNMVDSYYPNSCVVFNTNNKSDGLNIYLVNPFGLPQGARGLAEGIPSRNCIIAGSSGGNGGINALNSPLIHEVGHCLGLLHTFAGQANNPYGLCPPQYDFVYDCEGHISQFPALEAESDQCNTTGDKICDTPPDYSTFGTNTLGSNCSYGGYYPAAPFSSFCDDITLCYQGIGFQPNDPVQLRTASCEVFAPMVSNYMTTASNNNCRTAFTTDQGNVMQKFINTHGALASVHRSADDYANYTNCPCSANDIDINNEQAYNTNQIIPGNIFIHNGGNLTVTSTLSFTESKGIIVERGGKLNLNGGKLTAACNYKWWNGVEVEGNNTINQPDDYLSSTGASDAGIVYVHNNATIEKALNGISTIRHGEHWNEAYWGGLVQIKDSYFKYNRRAVEFMRYRVGLNGTNKSYITNSEFDGTSPNSTNTYGVTIWSSDGIQYERNRSSNNDKSALTIVDGWIKVVNSNDFTNNLTGVSCYATAPINSSVEVGQKSEANKNYFTNNQTAIEAYGADALNAGRVEIYANEIYQGNRGIFLQGNNDHKIGYNHIWDQPFGIIVSNSGDNNNLTHCNTLQNNTLGLVYQGINSKTQFKYNDFLNTTNHEVLLFSFSANNPASVRENQGATGDPAENCFSQGEGIANQIYTLGTTEFFKYLIPETNNTNYCVSGGPVPICDLNDGCTVPNNYLKVKTSNNSSKQEDCTALKTAQTPIFTINQYQHFDSLYNYYSNLCNTIPAACTNAQEYKILREQALRDVVRTYLASNNWTSTESFLTTASFEAAKQTLFGLYFRNRNWTAASSVLASLPASTTAQRQYKVTQTIALDYATNPSNLYLNPYKDSLLNAIAMDEWPAAAYAKSLLYLIKGEQLGFTVPILPRESNTLPKSEKISEEIVKIFPNPSSHSLNIKSLDPKLNLVKIELLNLQGLSLKLIESNVKSQILDVSTIANGTYLIIIELSDGTRINKSIQVFH